MTEYRGAWRRLTRLRDARRAARAVLEVERTDGAPEGVLSAGDGRRFPFSGWTEFAAVIEEWRSDAPSARPAGQRRRRAGGEGKSTNSKEASHG